MRSITGNGDEGTEQTADGFGDVETKRSSLHVAERLALHGDIPGYIKAQSVYVGEAEGVAAAIAPPPRMEPLNGKDFIASSR
jgi:hypothetical protein